MNITINGKSSEYLGPPTLGELLRSLAVDPKQVAIERNLRIISRNHIDNEPVEPEDQFEIIRLVGGG